MIALTGPLVSDANQESIDLDTFTVGNCVRAKYTSPVTESVTLNLKAANGDTVLHLDYRVNWGPNKDTLVLNTQTGGVWGTEQLVTDLKTTPGTLLFWWVCAKEDEFSILLNLKELTTYKYRVDSKVTRFEFTQYPNANATLMKLGMVYSQ